MKMIKAVVRPEAVEMITDSLAEAGFISITKFNASGRGKQKGIHRGDVHYDELPKSLLVLVVEDEDVDRALQVIRQRAYTGNFGDGKIFVIPVERAVTIRTGEEAL